MSFYIIDSQDNQKFYYEQKFGKWLRYRENATIFTSRLSADKELWELKRRYRGLFKLKIEKGGE
jgi:hypothetical protein